MNKNNKKKQLVLTILALVSLVLITAGVTYAFFTYAREGTKDNIVTAGSITFLYTETPTGGKGITLTDAFPIADSEGKVQTGEGNYFDFKITSNTSTNASIPYEVTVRKDNSSTLEDKFLKLYLTDRTSGTEEELVLSKFSELEQTSVTSDYDERVIYEGQVPTNSSNYEKLFRLRMWITDDEKFTESEMGKTFKLTVNVYANGKVITGEMDTDSTLSSLTVDSYTLTPEFSSETVDYTLTVPNEIEEVKVVAVANSAKAKVTGDGTKSLSVGDNTVSIKVKAENGDETTYKVVITREQDKDNTLADLSLSDCTLSPTFSKDTTSYTCTVDNSVESTTVTATTSSKNATLTGTGSKNLEVGSNTIEVKVTSQSGEEKTYTVTVTRKQGGVAIFGKEYEVIDAEPTLTTSSNNTSDASGLYAKTTNKGTTYYFRGNVTNNYVSFAGQTWRIVRINEDGTIRLIMANGINNDAAYVFNSSDNNYSYMYYSNSNAKTQLESWYNTNLASYSSYIATGDYFCEQAKVTSSTSRASQSGTTQTVYSSYTPDFNCSTDGNGKGLVNTSIGLITYDELVFAGGYYGKSNTSYYLYNGTYYWTMSPDGFDGTNARAWYVNIYGNLNDDHVYGNRRLRPVVNLNAETLVTGSGTSSDPFVVG